MAIPESAISGRTQAVHLGDVVSMCANGRDSTAFLLGRARKSPASE
jgi:hypothetical protein